MPTRRCDICKAKGDKVCNPAKNPDCTGRPDRKNRNIYEKQIRRERREKQAGEIIMEAPGGIDAQTEQPLRRGGYGIGEQVMNQSPQPQPQQSGYGQQGWYAQQPYAAPQDHGFARPPSRNQTWPQQGGYGAQPQPLPLAPAQQQQQQRDYGRQTPESRRPGYGMDPDPYRRSPQPMGSVNTPRPTRDTFDPIEEPYSEIERQLRQAREREQRQRAAERRQLAETYQRFGLPPPGPGESNEQYRARMLQIQAQQMHSVSDQLRPGANYPSGAGAPQSYGGRRSDSPDPYNRQNPGGGSGYGGAGSGNGRRETR